MSLKIAKVKSTYSELFFYLFFALMFGMRMWGIYESKPMYPPMLIVGMLLWLASIVLSEHNLFEYLLIFFFMGLSAIVYLNTGEKGVILYFALMLGMKGIDPKKLFKVGLAAGGSGLICLTFLSAFGIIEDVSYIHWTAQLGQVFRRSLGFAHPNILSSSFVILAIMLLYIIGYENIKKLIAISSVLLLFSIYIYVYSLSRTGLVITVGFIFLNLFYAYRNKIGLFEKMILAMLFPLIWTISIIGPLFVTERGIEIVRKFDYNLGSRWEVGNYYIKNNDLALFGQRLINPEGSVYGIDMSQLYLLLQLGVIAFVLITLLWIGLIVDEIRNNRVQELLITGSMLVMGITDPFLYNIGFKNIAFIFIGINLYKYVSLCLNRFPKKLRQPVVLLPLVVKTVSFPCIEKSCDENVSRERAVSHKRRRAAAICCGIIITLFAAGTFYLVSPEPDYVLADRNSGEQVTKVKKSLVGRTYSASEISNIRSSGNIVLNYTDDEELMYIYYAHEADEVPGGYYAPNAAGLEKFRLTVSIFFWGSFFMSVIYAAVTGGFGHGRQKYYDI